MVPESRACTKCGLEKLLSDFSKAPRGKYGHKASCKACDAERHAVLKASSPVKQRRKPGPPPANTSILKRCSRCGLEKPYSEFSLSRSATATTSNVYRSRCKECNSAAAQQWYWENVDRAAENRRRSDLAKYGISIDGYERMLKEQGGVCAICGNDEPGAHGRTGRKFRLSVDHCHDTGKVRGLLCQRCNRAVGLFGDDIDLLAKAIGYLERNGG